MRYFDNWAYSRQLYYASTIMSDNQGICWAQMLVLPAVLRYVPFSRRMPVYTAEAKGDKIEILPTRFFDALYT